MKKLLSLVLCIITVFSFVSCNKSGDGTVTTPESSSNVTTLSPEGTTPSNTTELQTTPEIPKENNPLDKTKNYSVLFIGNSYTHYNSMPDIFSRMATKAGYDVKVTAITKGGWYLLSHANANDETGAKVDKALKENKYDYVIIQEQSSCPIENPGKFYDGVREIYAKVKANGATPVLYCTWGRKAGHSFLSNTGLTNESMTWKIAAAYNAIGKELGIDVSYVGLAFFDVYSNNRSKVEIYDDDKTHPSAEGSYLAAITLFSDIFGGDPKDISYNPGMRDEVIDILKNASSEAVLNTPAIPGNYKTSSEGVKREKDYDIDTSAMKNLTSLPSMDKLIYILKGGSYPNGKNFSGILGDKNAISSKEYSTTGLSDVQKADIADIGYGVSVIGIEKMFSSSKGYTTAVENLVNGHWGASMMACFEFDGNKYSVDGKVDSDGKYIGLITLNFGEKKKFDAFGFSSGSLEGFPGVAEVFVSDDCVNWTLVPTACWDNINGVSLANAGTTPADPWNSNTAKVSCLFDMNGAIGKYIRVGIIIGRNDTPDKYNTINTREILVFGAKAE